MDSIRDLTTRINAFRDARDWKQFHNPKDMAVSISIESAELLEQFQGKTPRNARRIYRRTAKPWPMKWPMWPSTSSNLPIYLK